MLSYSSSVFKARGEGTSSGDGFCLRAVAGTCVEQFQLAGPAKDRQDDVPLLLLKPGVVGLTTCVKESPTMNERPCRYWESLEFPGQEEA